MTPSGLLTPVVGSRLVAYIKHRLSLHRTHALVPVTGTPDQRGQLAALRIARDAYWVHLGERTANFTCQVGTSGRHHGQTVDISLVWWVDDPQVVVDRRVLDAVPYLRRDIQHRLTAYAADRSWPSTIAMQEQCNAFLQPAAVLDTVGIGYGHIHLDVTDPAMPEIRKAELDDVRWTSDVELERQQLERLRLDYYQRLVQDGPTALLAYWLQQRPNDIKDIIDYAQRLPPPPPDPMREVDLKFTKLMTELSDFDRQRVRQWVAVAMAHSGTSMESVLRELGFLGENGKATDPLDEEQPWP
ncbi:hypothetical protein [Yinghuangia seranimata]|uniref:hypothetical protein n=1 Tax=Yinghuangia seranimata TaxID=408067 RepID=UPI00248C33A0|nr:hypothetical protein [Yinghuangia seranimata]MDI2132554.1 hypothetical protein [Yinghuangia seranimata]